MRLLANTGFYLLEIRSARAGHILLSGSGMKFSVTFNMLLKDGQPANEQIDWSVNLNRPYGDAGLRAFFAALPSVEWQQWLTGAAHIRGVLILCQVKERRAKSGAVIVVPCWEPIEQSVLHHRARQLRIELEDALPAERAQIMAKAPAEVLVAYDHILEHPIPEADCPHCAVAKSENRVTY